MFNMIILKIRTYILLFILLTCLLPFTAHAQKKGPGNSKRTIAVLEFSGNGIYAVDICISSTFREELSKIGKLTVRKRSDMY